MKGPSSTPYPGYDVLDKWDTPSFNDQTRDVLRRRLTDVPDRRFFTAAEWPVLEALCDAVMPQEKGADAVPIPNWIDAALHEGHGSGTRHADMPAAPDAWRQGLAALNSEAQLRGASDFAALGNAGRDAVLHDVDAEKGRAPQWQTLPQRRFFRNLVLSEIVAIYYSHPTGQSEIGFGGPASPRGYVRLQANRADSWEAPPGDWGGETPR